MYSEDDLIPISALQHILFCERQCALIHVEGLWAENIFTVEGEHMHDKVDEQGSGQIQAGVRVARGLPLRSLRLGLVGKADVVEFHPTSEGGAILEGVSGRWKPYPVEYKRGQPKKDHCDEVQLCAQALCLEEMLGVPVPEGALFYGRTRRRVKVLIDKELRGETEETAARVHKLISNATTPRAVREQKCERCSLLNLCLPDMSAPSRSASHYLTAVFEDQP